MIKVKNVKIIFFLALPVMALVFFMKPCRQEVDVSGSIGMISFLEKMKKGSESKEDLTRDLEKLLESKSYKLMFHHYNRPIRPHELPENVFRDMILSLSFPDTYKPGENSRADSMLPLFKMAFEKLDSYEGLAKELSSSKMKKRIKEAVSFSQSWLPEDMKLEEFYLFILAQGGSSAFVVPANKAKVPSQGVDLFQIVSEQEGFEEDKFLMMVAHESHHLAYQAYAQNLEWGPGKQFLAMVVAEGVANAMINNLPDSKGNKIRSSSKFSESLSAKAQSEWENYQRDSSQLINRFLSDMKTLSKGYKKETIKYWLGGGSKQRLYFIGVEAVHRAFKKGGKEEVFKLMKDPGLLVPLLF